MMKITKYFEKITRYKSRVIKTVSKKKIITTENITRDFFDLSHYFMAQ